MIEWINSRIFGALIPIFLIGGGVFFGFYLKWFYIRHPIKTLKEAFSGGVRSAFSSLCLALAGTLGVGNIVGVASALVMGGYGAVLWIWVSAFFAMMLKYAETLLALGHKREGGGSAMNYIEDLFLSLGKRKIGEALSVCFALFLVLNALSMGGAIQTEAVAASLHGFVGVPKFLVAAVMGGVTLLIILKGKRGIMSVTEKIVPVMSLCFAVMSVAALALRYDRLPDAFILIFDNALTTTAAVGGIFGFLTSRALRFGTMRGLISNEAGCGTSPMAHSECDGRSPAAQGIFGIFEVFVDTIVLCTMTALVIIVSGVPLVGEGFMEITVSAYSAILGGVARPLLAFSVAAFGFATVICWSHYGITATKYISSSPIARRGFLSAYVAFIIIGGVARPTVLWQLADLSMGVMTVINISVLIAYRREIKAGSLKLLG